MKISDLKISNYVVVNDLGASKYSSGMRVIGKVVEIDGKGNYAIIESLPKHRYEITDFNDFELWTKEIEDKTESMGLNKQSNDVQQRKRKEQNVKPDYYQFDDFEMYEIVEAICKHYNPVVAAWIGQAIQYIGRAPRKNGKEDIGKARDMIERAFEVWDVK
ncbi:DUF3310 domain-containing protein [Staphylococcus sp. GDK8D30P]|uniref:DUF3310 domain-containing protein n=1 Tax=Staphylococcus sp. GDK8D30P TaxID=2804090 RepID=UPI001AEBEE42|nr:DUF3310 domain-containing protein [Staphylococcus sp. GDK8D30P]